MSMASEKLSLENFKIFFLPYWIGLEWIDIIASLSSLLKSYFFFTPNVKACRTIIYFKLIKCITDKNIQFYIEATLRISLELTKKECWGNLQVVLIVKIAFPLGEKNERDLSLVSKGKIS